MNTDLTRQYNLPTPVSNSTTSILEQYKADNNSTTGTLSIPDLQDLLNLKAELETLLPLSKSRVKDLKTDLNNLDHNVKIRDNGETPTSGKNMNAIMKIKQESDTSNDLHSSSNIPKDEQSRQAALETIRRRRRREETESSDEVTQRRSESPHQMVKLRKLDNMPALPNIPSKQQKSTTATNNTKKKSNNARAQHPLSESSGKQHSKKSNGHNQKEELDFIRVKAKDQVPVATFWAALEPYLRNLTEEDRTFLLEKSDNAKYFLIPPLGQYYTEAWAEEDQAIGFDSHTRSTSNSSASFKSTHKSKHQNNENSTEDDTGFGSLTDRLLSSLVAEELIDLSESQVKEEEEEDETIDDSHQGKTVLELSTDPTDEIVDFEERLRRELRYAGLFGDDDIDWNAKEDDEICAELRTLQREFKEQLETNESRKKKLLQVVDSQLQFEQYRQVLDTLDSQVEQGYIKRFRPQKSKKRKTNGPKSTLSENAVFAMDKRKTWIQALGAIFKDKNLIMPTSSIYEEKEEQPPV